MGLKITPEQMRIYKDQISIGKEYYEKKFKKRYEQNIRLYRGDHPSLLEGEGDKVTINEIKVHVKNKIAAVAGQPPTWTITPKNPDGIKAALILPYILPELWDEMKAHDITKACFKDAKINLLGIARVGYIFETKNVSMMGQKPAEGTFNPEDIIKDAPFVERIDIKKVILDPEVDHPNYEKGKFIAIQLDFEKEDLVNNPRFNQDVVKKLTPDSQIDKDYTVGIQDINKKDHLQRYTVWEFYDIKKDLFIYISEQADEPLYIMKNPYGFNPFEFIWNDTDPDGIFDAKSDVEDLKDQQLERNLVHSTFATKIRRNRNKYQAPEGMLTEAGKNALESDIENALVEIDPKFIQENPGVDYKIDLIPIDKNSFDLKEYDALIEKNMYKTSGISEYQTGVMPEERRTATEASMIGNLSGTRANDELEEYQNFCERIAEKIIKLLSIVDEQTGLPKFLPAERFINLTGRELSDEFMGIMRDSQQLVEVGNQVFLRYTGAHLAGDFSIKVEYGSTQRANKELERKQELDLFTTLTNNQVALQMVNMQELLKGLLLKFDKDPQKYIMEQQPITQVNNVNQQTIGPPQVSEIPDQPTPDMMRELASMMGQSQNMMQ